MSVIRKEALELLVSLPASDSPSLVPDGQHRTRTLRILNQLEEHGFVEVVRKRPKTVRVANSPYAKALHGILRTRPHFLAILTGHHVAVIAVLAATSKGETVESIAATTGRHPNTIRSLIKNLRQRAVLRDAPAGFRLAPHVPELAELGHLYNEHQLAKALQRAPGAFPVARRGARVIVEASQPVPQLPATGIYRLQQEGAPVLESRFQYVVTQSGRNPTLVEAYEDAKALGTPPRTLDAAKNYLRDRGLTIA